MRHCHYSGAEAPHNYWTVTTSMNPTSLGCYLVRIGALDTHSSTSKRRAASQLLYQKAYRIEVCSLAASVWAVG